jgi:hypothetical protein
MKRLILAALTAAICLLSMTSCFGEELWNPHLRGIDDGCISGALPPKGVYFVNNSYFGSLAGYNGAGKESAERLDLYVDVPIVLYSPGYKVLHATYAMAIAQPFDYTSVYSRTAATVGNGHWGLYNTVVVPAILSWSQPHNIFLKAALATYLDDPSTSPAHPDKSGGAGSGNSYYTIEPNFAISYLKNGWNLSADLKYDHNITDWATGYHSGDEFDGDYTATKTNKQWTVGLVGYQTNQLYEDKLKGVTQSDSIHLTYGAGPTIGYNFGPLDVVATFNYNISTHNDFGGNTANIRVIMPL